MAFDIIKRILKKYYKENITLVVYHFGNKEAVRILGDWVLRERQLINTDLFDIESVKLVGDTIQFEIKDKVKTPPPPPPPNTTIPPEGPANDIDKKEDLNEDIPQRISL
jgi:hypothetical protein